MPAKKKESVAKRPNLFVVIGSDDGQVRERALKLSQEKLPATAGDFGLEIIDGSADNSDAMVGCIAKATEAILSLPFFGGGKLVWVKNATFLSDSSSAKAEATISALESFLELLDGGMADDVVFLLSATDVDKRRSFWLNLDKIAHVETYDLPDTSRAGWEAEIEVLATREADKRGLSFSPDALDLFVVLAGERSQQIMSELDKIDLYLGPSQRRITIDVIREIVPLSREGGVFELGNALGTRDPHRVLKLLDQLMTQGESAIGILLGGIIPRIRNLLLARDLVERHRVSLASYQSFQAALSRLPEGETAHLPRKKDGSGLNVYPLFLAAQEAGKFSASELREALDRCLEANYRLVMTGLDSKVVLSQLVVRILVPNAMAA